MYLICKVFSTKLYFGLGTILTLKGFQDYKFLLITNKKTITFWIWEINSTLSTDGWTVSLSYSLKPIYYLIEFSQYNNLYNFLIVFIKILYKIYFQLKINLYVKLAYKSVLYKNQYLKSQTTVLKYCYHFVQTVSTLKVLPLSYVAVGLLNT